MKDTVELEVSPGGSIGLVYQDGVEDFADAIGAEHVRTCRVSYVEPEGNCWTVRSANSPQLCLRANTAMIVHDESIVEIQCSSDINLPIMAFRTREEALMWELHFLKELRNGEQEKGSE